MKAIVHDCFTKLLRLQKDVAKSQLQAATGESSRQWFVDPSFTGDLLDPAALTSDVFNRTNINANYADCLKDASDMGSVGDVASLQQQLDYVAGAERAFRYRHTSFVRAQAHSTARSFGLVNGPTLDRIEAQVASTIRAGATGG